MGKAVVGYDGACEEEAEAGGWREDRAGSGRVKEGQGGQGPPLAPVSWRGKRGNGRRSVEGEGEEGGKGARKGVLWTGFGWRERRVADAKRLFCGCGEEGRAEWLRERGRRGVGG